MDGSGYTRYDAILACPGRSGYLLGILIMGFRKGNYLVPTLPLLGFSSFDSQVNLDRMSDVLFYRFGNETIECPCQFARLIRNTGAPESESLVNHLKEEIEFTDYLT